MVSLMLTMCKPVFGTGKDVVWGIVFFVAKCITEIEVKGVYEVTLSNNQCYCLKGFPGETADTHFKDK